MRRIYKFNVALILLLSFQFLSAQTDSLKFRISTNYLNGFPNLTKTKVIENSKSEIDIYFFKEHFDLFYGLPKKLIKKKFKGQQIDLWGLNNKPQTWKENWTESYIYDSKGRLTAYIYSGCKICSQLSWGYKLIYNKNDKIIEQQIFNITPKTYRIHGKFVTKYDFDDKINNRIKMTYNNKGNIIMIEKLGLNGIEDLIELIE